MGKGCWGKRVMGEADKWSGEYCGGSEVIG